MSNQNNKPNMNMFNNSQMNQEDLLKQMRTQPLIKHIVALLVGFLPMIVTIFLVGVNTDEIKFGQWQNIHHTFSISYGAMWAVGFLVMFISIVLISLIIKFSKDVKIDTIPMVTSWSCMMFSLFIIPLDHGLLFLEIILIPIFAAIGFFFGMVGVMMYSIAKFSKEMQKMQETNGGQNPFEFKPGQNPFDQSKTKPQNKSKTIKKDEEPINEDNPFVDIKEDDD